MFLLLLLRIGGLDLLLLLILFVLLGCLTVFCWWNDWFECCLCFWFYIWLVFCFVFTVGCLFCLLLDFGFNFIMFEFTICLFCWFWFDFYWCWDWLFDYCAVLLVLFLVWNNCFVYCLLVINFVVCFYLYLLRLFYCLDCVVLGLLLVLQFTYDCLGCFMPLVCLLYVGFVSF